MSKKISVVSLGCDKNLIDTEYMLALLSTNKYEFSDNYEDADIIIINTCGFIESAKKESIETINEMSRYKETGKCRTLIVTGCLAQRYKEDLLEQIPQIDAVVGTGSYNKIVEVIKECEKSRKSIKFDDIDAPYDINDRVLTTPGHSAYLKIAEGCSNFCTYCIIPKLRGKYRSRPMESILHEAEQLSKSGVKEIIVIAQDTTKYGVDIYKKKMLSELLNELCKFNFKWIRLLYCYPEGINDELINVIKTQDKICNYLDIPMQHCNDKILKLMGRRSSKEKLVELISKLRKEIPDIIIRTSLIVGFPGETLEEFNDLLDFLKTTRLNRVGAFTYSKEEGTKAATFENQVSEEEKQERLDKLMTLQQQISFENNEKMLGKTLEVLVEEYYQDENYYCGRTYMDSPEIDGQVYFDCDKIIEVGEFVNVKINEFDEYDLIGEINYEFTK